MKCLHSAAMRSFRVAVLALLAVGADVQTLSAGETHGVVWEDLDGHGVVSLRSPLIAGITIYLDLNENGHLDGLEPSTVTNDYGRYAFGDLPAGGYKVTMVVPEGWTLSFPPRGGQLLFVDAVRNGTDAARGMDGIHSVTTSPDGAHLYTTGIFDDALGVFQRDAATGELTHVQTVRDGVNGADGLDGACAAAVSWDGKNVYALGAHDDALVVLARDDESGELTPVQVLWDDQDGVDGLDSPRSVVLSPDGRSVYAAGAYEDSVAAFSRDETTGRLTFLHALRDGEGGVDGLYGVCDVALSPDGRHLYAAGADDNALGALGRDRATGRLTFLQVLREGEQDVEGLYGIRSVVVSPEGRQVYAASADGDTVTVFSRDEISGQLALVQVVRDGQDGVTGLYGASALQVGADGRHVYATGSYEDAMVVFTRSTSSGKLTFKQVVRDEQGFVDGLDGARSLAVSLDGQHVYAAGSYEDAVAIFKLEMIHYVNLNAGEVVQGIDFGVYEEPKDIICRTGDDNCPDPTDDNGDSADGDGSSGPSTPGSRLCGVAMLPTLAFIMLSLSLWKTRRLSACSRR